MQTRVIVIIMPCQTSTAERLSAVYQSWIITTTKTCLHFGCRHHEKVKSTLSNQNKSIAVRQVDNWSKLNTRKLEPCNEYLSRQWNWRKWICKWTTGFSVQVGKADKIATSQHWKALPWYTDEWTWCCASQKYKAILLKFLHTIIALDLDEISTYIHTAFQCWSVSNTLKGRVMMGRWSGV